MYSNQFFLTSYFHTLQQNIPGWKKNMIKKEKKNHDFVIITIIILLIFNSILGSYKGHNNNFIRKMLQAPRRQRVINLPKDGSRAGFFSERNSSKHSTNSLNSAHMQFSFNLNDYQQRTQQQINISNQMIVKPQAKRTIDHLYTVNPEKIKNNQIGSINFNNKNKQSLRKQHVHPSILQGPLIEDASNQELYDSQEPSFEMSNANIKKLSLTQKPLKQQVSVQISSPPKKVAPFDKIEQNDKKINQFKKNDSISFCNEKLRVFPSLSRMGNSEPESVMRLAKKQLEFQTSSSNLQYQTKKQSEQKKPLIQYGHLLAENKLSKLKNEINNIVSQKSKNKAKINYTNQTRIQDDHQMEQAEKQRPNSNFLFGSTTKNSFLQSRLNKKFIFSDALESTGQSGRTADYRSFSNPKNGHYGVKKITISYKTSINQLTQILRNISQSESSQIQILVPKILMTTYFDQNMQRTDLYNHAKYIFTSLGIPAQNLTIKKYSNCILMVAKNICLLWHFDGKVYLGGWQIQYLDEGVKHGLGLEWVPNKYVYYGEYTESKKSGLGVLKTREETYIGEWSQGKRTDNGHIVNQNGQILHPRVSFDGNAKSNQLFGQQSLDTDPFF